ncbi:hypothetical protein DAPPUDRAFT_113827 [Daphnia pulex]|uniref:Uncharacterized protein n=1 Tax=Daphnia pulex TaxID=6669 RepID=E9HG84_DAPPU|nr:hypothetical protein DAPPUDRAFT_113827 [Daphnia pulex]|eukprot:EFX69269.1 hypothetical protein DAPPUDRAFT_113827 [Daphnia pulex]
MHSDKKRSKRKGSKDDTPNRLALPKASKNLSERVITDSEESMNRVLAESEPDSGAKSRRAPRKNPDGTLNLPRSRPSSRASDRNPSGSPPVINLEGNTNEPQSPKIGLTIDDIQRQAGAQHSPEILAPNLEGFGVTPERKTLSELIGEEFTRFNGEMTAIAGRLNMTDARVTQTVARLESVAELSGISQAIASLPVALSPQLVVPDENPLADDEIDVVLASMDMEFITTPFSPAISFLNSWNISERQRIEEQDNEEEELDLLMSQVNDADVSRLVEEEEEENRRKRKAEE